MPHATADMEMLPRQPRRLAKSSAKSASRDVQQLLFSLKDLQSLYRSSQYAITIAKQLQNVFKRSPTKITRVLSLGLGSLLVTKGRGRRLKQLTILLAIRSELKSLYDTHIEIYAQDPTFTRTDEALLSSLDIKISRTTSGSSLGEAAALISPHTMIYSPFLTMEAYEQLLLRSSLIAPFIFGDDFNALLEKWPKYSDERRQVEVAMKAGLSKYRRRTVRGEGFWMEEDGSFPMAMYERQESRGNAKIKAQI